MGWEAAAVSIRDAAVPTGVHRVPLLKCLDTILAEDLIAPADIPMRGVAGLDGYAVGGGTGPEKATMRLIAFLRTGSHREIAIGKGETVKVEEGALLPKGTQRVVAADRAKESGGYVEMTPGDGPTHTIAQGADFKKGDVLFSAGSRIEPSQLALLSFLGVASPRVRRIPSVALLTVGNELCGILEEAGPGKVRDLNAFLLAGMAKRMGGRASLFGPAPDEASAVAEATIRAVRAPGVVVISGGMGKYGNVTSSALARIGFVEQVRVEGIRPAGTVLFGSVGDVFVFALPGNATTALAAFTSLVIPFLRRMAGESGHPSAQDPLPVDQCLDLDPARVHLLPARVVDGALALHPPGRNRSLPPLPGQGDVVALCDLGRGPVEEGDLLEHFALDPLIPFVD